MRFTRRSWRSFFDTHCTGRTGDPIRVMLGMMLAKSIH